MHSAPSVIYPVGRSRYAARILVALWLAGAFCVCSVSFQIGTVNWRTVMLEGSLVLSALALGHALRRRPGGELRFVGQDWHLSGAGGIRAARLAPALDFQSLLLVRLDAPQQRTRWQWLERSSAPERWLDLRRAVYSRAPSVDPDGARAAPQRPAQPDAP